MWQSETFVASYIWYSSVAGLKLYLSFIRVSASDLTSCNTLASMTQYATCLPEHTGIKAFNLTKCLWSISLTKSHRQNLCRYHSIRIRSHLLIIRPQSPSSHRDSSRLKNTFTCFAYLKTALCNTRVTYICVAKSWLGSSGE